MYWGWSGSCAIPIRNARDALFPGCLTCDIACFHCFFASSILADKAFFGAPFAVLESTNRMTCPEPGTTATRKDRCLPLASTMLLKGNFDGSRRGEVGVQDGQYEPLAARAPDSGDVPIHFSARGQKPADRKRYTDCINRAWIGCPTFLTRTSRSSAICSGVPVGTERAIVRTAGTSVAEFEAVT